jgi:preprotein translocase subunit SecE
VADRKRGRSADDEFDDEVPEAAEDLDDELTEDELTDEFDEDEEFEDDDDLEDDLDEADDDARESTRTRSRAGAVGTRTRTRPRTREATRRGPIGRLFAYLRNFVREVVAELQKVIWPTRKELLTYTAVVVVFVSLLMAIVAGLDVAFGKLMFLVFGSDTAASDTQ